MEKETKHSVEYLSHNPNQLKTITIEIDKFLTDHEYIKFSVQKICDGSKTAVLFHPSEN